MRRVRPLVALAIAGLMLLPGAVTAAPAVSITGVTVSGGTGSVTGSATFDAITGPHSVVSEDESTFGGTPPGSSALGDAAGIDIADATITPIANGLRFTWIMNSMPEHTPPEGIRYTWAFKIGNNMYQLQAKRTNVIGVSTTEDPVGTAQHHAANKNAFELRGACVAEYQGAPINGCYHLAWLDGSFDPANKKVTVDLPFETKDAIGRVVAPNFKPGAVLVDNGGESTAGMVVAASFQAVVSNTQTSQFINGIKPYYLGPQVVLGVAAANQDPSTITYSAPGVLAGNTFSGTVSGLTASKNTVYARACNGTECSYSSFRAL